MSLTVTPAAGEPGEQPDVEISATPPSPLDGLKAKLAAARSKLFKDIEVPRWPEMAGIRVFVRYAPLDPSYAAKANEKFREEKTEDWEVRANAQKLIHCCQGIYGTDLNDTERKFSLRTGQPDSDWTKFDAHLAVTLSMIDSPDDHASVSAIAICREFYFTEGDLLAAVAELADWSILGSEESARDFPTPSRATL